MRHYSYSQLKTYDQCPLKFKFEYIDKRRSNFEGIEAFMGQRVHDALRRLYEELVNGRREELEHLIDFYNLRWDEEMHDGVQIVRSGTTAQFYFNQGLGCIQTFYHQNCPFEQSRTVALEERVEFSLDRGGQRRFVGRVDRIASRGNQSFEIHDYKTTRRDPDECSTEEERQLGLYELALRSAHPEVKHVDLFCHYLVRGIVHRQRRTEPQLLRVLQETNSRIDHVEAQATFPARVSKLCDWCEFREICPAWASARKCRGGSW